MPAVARAVVEINVSDIGKQGPALAAALLVVQRRGGSRDHRAVLRLRQLHPVVAHTGRGGMPIVATDEPVVVVLGVHDPGQHEVPLI